MGVRSIKDNTDELTVALYLQVSIISQALISVTRSRSWSFVEQRPDLLLVFAFIAAQLVSFFASSTHVGGDCHRGVCLVGVCRDPGHRTGVGWGHLALQPHHLLPSRRSQVHHSLRSEWKSLG
ncbi:hypothetical protein GW17_00022451 [Ensete ventricosum]|nr:hypothetical protein GW17_00022451 [Ensete ventricosum]RZR84890.1 hypothetical protein BHM03_00011781 [Ensete ventricosum]